MEELSSVYVTSAEAANILSITPKATGLLVRQGKLPAEKIANRWLIPRSLVEEFAKTYEGRRGRPRVKRKYTKRSPRWNTK